MEAIQSTLNKIYERGGMKTRIKINEENGLTIDTNPEEKDEAIPIMFKVMEEFGLKANG
ncbi:MAG: hypothetical protein RBR32_07830 [Bacteroidales bacterium]|nr:hypothetical protein [Bacteroidales bacterium]